ncbi:FkbM family methyltransferase [Tunicatimonas pelagia]|uniref:FkbM family methyltransferase n=1 Tax=Tunicatimonas pelagia TaxID=931531 RepID=UPI0026651817|nr:FkbM family methyltransferase [Tunicatimonas pelagia]WKN41940.1 FkbM family methyltransferase [Tunicatimonas pelagia]
MMSKNKIRRYRNLFAHFENWPQYLWFKMFGYQASFDFQLKGQFSVRVPRQMLSAFRECFFDQIYFKNIPEHLLTLKNPTIVDIGANVGYFSLFMFYKFPEAISYAFEPMSFNFQMLEKYKETYPTFNWHIEPQAISDNNIPITLHTSKLDGSTTMASIFSQPGNGQQIQVQSTTLPQFLEKNSINYINLLKLYCQGAEYAILYSLPQEVLDKICIVLIKTHRGTKQKETNQALRNYLQAKQYQLK